jgi:EmrB/QacA subfamily drug resistance transporter
LRADAVSKHTSTVHPRATLAATILGSSLAFIDGSVVNVALPALAKDLHAGPASLPWAINAYLLPLGAVILLGGGLGDRYGRRRYFLIGLTGFTLASVLCAFAPTYAWLLAGRSVQGLGAALLMPNSLAILGAQFKGEERGRAIGLWAAAGALTGAIGPVVGGWMVDVIGWRVIFLINVPLAAAAAFLAWRYVAENTAKANALSLPLDVTGAVLATAGLGLLTWSLTEASGQAGASLAVGLLSTMGASLLALFVMHERRLKDRALMPPALFVARAFVGLNLFTLLLYASLGGLLVLLPYVLIQFEHWPAVAAGAALLPVSALIGLGSGVMGKLASRYGARWPLTIGAILVAVGFVLYGRIGPPPVSYWSEIFPATLLIALGLCACVAPLTTAVMESVDAAHTGIASGLNNAVARVAGLIATALLGFVFAQQASAESFIAAFRRATIIGAGLALAAAVCAFWYLGRNVGNANERKKRRSS